LLLLKLILGILNGRQLTGLKVGLFPYLAAG